jgi:hypothetical protein
MAGRRVDRWEMAVGRRKAGFWLLATGYRLSVIDCFEPQSHGGREGKNS